MIPKNLKHAEAGALLIAVGAYMVDHNVTAEVVLDFASCADPGDARLDTIRAIVNADPFGDITEERAEELLVLTLEEAITFNEMESKCP